MLRCMMHENCSHYIQHLHLLTFAMRLLVTSSRMSRFEGTSRGTPAEYCRQHMVIIIRWESQFGST